MGHLFDYELIKPPRLTIKQLMVSDIIGAMHTEPKEVSAFLRRIAHRTIGNRSNVPSALDALEQDDKIVLQPLSELDRGIGQFNRFLGGEEIVDFDSASDLPYSTTLRDVFKSFELMLPTVEELEHEMSQKPAVGPTLRLLRAFEAANKWEFFRYVCRRRVN